MASVVEGTAIRTLEDLLERLGHVPLHRIRFRAIGRATLQDVIDIADHEGRLCELIDGVLVEKAMGHEDSFLALWLGTLLNNFVVPRNLGIVTGEAGTVELMPDLVRIPDVAFTCWDSMEGRRRPTDPIPRLAPTLAVEVLSASNTRGEMAVKRQEYFAAGVLLVWEVDPATRTVVVYTSPTQATTLTAADTLDGAPALPGFTLPLATLFAELDRHG